MPTRLRSLKQIEEKYGVPRPSLARLIRVGVIPPEVAPHLGRRVFVDEAAFERFLAAGGRGLETTSADSED